MEYKVFEAMFKEAGFTERQMKKVREFSYDAYAESRGRKTATGGQKQMAYDAFVRVCKACADVDTLAAFFQGVCKVSREQIEALFNSIR